METWEWIAIGAVAAVLLLVLLLLVGRRRSRTARSDLLRRRFGPEYDRVVSGSRGRAAGERELAGRLARREQLELRDLGPAARDRYRGEWDLLQARFVDDPSGAADEADRLVRRVLAEIGYAEGPDDRSGVGLVAVDEPEIVSRYRHGHELLERPRQGADSTEALREAMVDFRAALDGLLHDRRAA